MIYIVYLLSVIVLATGRLRYCPYKRKIFAAGSLLAEAFSFFSLEACYVSADKLQADAILLFIRAPYTTGRNNVYSRPAAPPPSGQ